MSATYNKGDLVVAICDASGNDDLQIKKDHLYEVHRHWSAGGYDYLTVSLPDSPVTCEFYSWRFKPFRPEAYAPKKKLAKIHPECDTRGQFKNSSIAPSGGVKDLADVLDLIDWIIELTATTSPRKIQAVRCKEMILQLATEGACHAQGHESGQHVPGPAPGGQVSSLGSQNRSSANGPVAGHRQEAQERKVAARFQTVNHDNYGRARPEILLSPLCDND